MLISELDIVFTFGHWLYCAFPIIICNVLSQRLVYSSHEYLEFECLLPASPKAKAGLGVQSLRPSVRPKILSSQLL